MKYYAKLLAMMAICAGMASCSNDGDEIASEPSSQEGQVTLFGSFDEESAASMRTLVDTDGQTVLFDQNDKISVFRSNGSYGEGNGGMIFSIPQEGLAQNQRSAEFTGTLDNQYYTGDFAILYPYSTDVTYHYSTKQITVVVPTNQAATNNPKGIDYPTFDPKANLSVALSDANNRFTLRNVCSLIRFNADKDCRSVVFSDAYGRAIAGQVKVNLDGTIDKTVVGTKTVSLNNVMAGQVYFVAVLPGDIRLNVKFITSDGKYYTKTAPKLVTLKRSEVLNIGKAELPEETSEGFEYVDLGKGGKWATCNVGANSPEEYGDYFAWGKTEPYYKSLVWTNGNKCTIYWKDGMAYNTTTYKLTTECYENGMLKPEYDAATVNWGSAWRMPTEKELKDMYENCNLVSTSNYKGTGISGIICYKKKEGTNPTYSESDTHIFWPKGGWIQNTTWSRNSGYDALYLLRDKSGTDTQASITSITTSGTFIPQSLGRTSGCMVRPVYVGD